MLSQNVDLVPGTICALKLAEEVDGVYQKCSVNKELLNVPPSLVRLLAPGIIEGVFDVKLSAINDQAFPPPWSAFGDTKFMGKVLIAKSSSIPPIGTNAKVRFRR